MASTLKADGRVEFGKKSNDAVVQQPIIKLGVLGSTRGTVLQAVIDAIDQGVLAAKVCVVISNRADAYILERARQHHIPAYAVDYVNHTPMAYHQKLSSLLHEHQVDLVLLIGYMKILSVSFVDEWNRKILNIHPSLLPKYAGLMDQAVHQAVFDARDTRAGCTVHYVNHIVDGGDILLQKSCDVAPSDTVISLRTKVQQLEGSAFIEAIQRWGTLCHNPY